ncbi:unnamed protein product, partial [Symbiodinium necroappetens]
ADAADESQKDRLSRCKGDLMQVLGLASCNGLEAAWPSDASTSSLLQQLGEEQSFAYCRLRHGELHGIGLGSNKQTCERAACLALALASLLEQRPPPWLEGELSGELQRAKDAEVLHLDLPHDVESMDDMHDAGRDARGFARVPANMELPQSGTWVWWLGGIPVVLCEDQTVGVFQQGKNWLMEVLGLTALPESLCEGKVCEVNKDRLDMVFPDIYCTGLWQLAHQNQQWQVVAVGRNVEERYRAACVGLASQIANAHGASKWWPQVQREFDHGHWLPADELGRFYDVKKEGFWANVASWQQADSKPGLPLALADISTLPGLTKQGFKDLRMTCQPALHRELRAQDGYAEIDLTLSGRPWPSILAAHKMRDEIVGPGVVRFAIASDERKLDKR